MREKISLEEMSAGVSLPESLYDETGKLIVSAGSVLSEDRLQKLRRRYFRGLFRDTGSSGVQDSTRDVRSSRDPKRADTAVLEQSREEPLAAKARADDNTVGVASLRVGMQLSQSICDPSGVLLLAAGSKITPRFLNLLRRREIQTVHIGPEKTNDNSIDDLDQFLTSELEIPRSISQLRPSDRAVLSIEDLYSEARKSLETYIKTTSVLQEISRATMNGRSVSSAEIKGVMNGFVNMLTLDRDLLVTITTMKESLGEYLFDHSMNVALLSMTTAMYMGITEEQVLQIGLGAVLQDVGMLLVPDKIRLAPRRLAPEEMKEIQQHPTYTIDQLDRVTGLPMVARLIGYQVHERIDGSGYPRSRSGMTVHPYAKIVSVVDTFAAMTRPRPYRTAIVPHVAMKQILVDASQEKFDRNAVRAFADVMSIFPIGSSVELNDGTAAKVVRANPGAHTRPVVASVDAAGDPTDRQVDLLKDETLGIAKAL